MIATLAFLLLQATPTPAAATRAADEATIARAGELLRAGKPAEVPPLLDPLIAREDAAAAAEKRRTYSGQTIAMTLLNMGLAAKDKVGAIDAGPAYAQAVYLRGYALLELGQVAAAGAAYEKTLALSPFNPTYHSEHGFWLRKQGKLDAAMAEYKEAEAYSGLFGGGAPAAQAKAGALRGEGYILTDQHRLDEAQARYEESLKLEPGNAVALHELDYIRRERAKPAGRTAT